MSNQATSPFPLDLPWLPFANFYCKCFKGITEWLGNNICWDVQRTQHQNYELRFYTDVFVACRFVFVHISLKGNWSIKSTFNSQFDQIKVSHILIILDNVGFDTKVWSCGYNFENSQERFLKCSFMTSAILKATAIQTVEVKENVF